MTVSSTTAKSGPYVGNGSTKAFAYNFRILDATHLQVIRTNLYGATEVVSPSEYTVSGVGSNSGNVTFTVAPASGIKLVILRNVPRLQPTDFQNQGAYYAEDVEAALDRNMMAMQQLDEELDRSVRAPLGDTAGDMTLPDALARAGKVLEFDATGKPRVGSFSTEGLNEIASAILNDRIAAEQAAINAQVYASDADTSEAAAAASATSAAQSVAAITDIVLTAQPAVFTFSGDGVTTVFPLTVSDPPLESSFVFIAGVYQKKDTYSFSGATIVFTAAPAAGANNVQVITGGFTTIATTTIGGVTGLTAALAAKLDTAGGTMAGVLRTALGTTTLPGLAGAADASTGWVLDSGFAALSTAGVEAFRVNNLARMIFGNGGANTNHGLWAGKIQIHGGAANGIAAYLWSTDNTYAPTMVFARSQNASVGTHTITSALYTPLMRLEAYGSNGTQHVKAGVVEIQVGSGTPGAASMPGRFSIQLSPDGSTTPAERFLIDASGNARINGQWFVGDGTGGTGNIYVEGGAGNNKSVFFRSGNASRFRIGTNSSAESGANAGSNFFINRYADDGTTVLGTSVLITRSNGDIAVALGSSGGIVFNGSSADVSIDPTGITMNFGRNSYNYFYANAVGGEFVWRTNGSTAVKMNLDTAGNLILGGGLTTLSYTSGSTDGAQVYASGQLGSVTDNATNLFLRRRNSAATADWVYFYHGSTPSGELRGTSGGTPVLAASSDVRLKTDIEEVTAAESGARIDALIPRKFKKVVSGDYIHYGFVAQELREVIPNDVAPMGNTDGLPPLAEGEEPYLSATATSPELIMLMLAEIKALRARVAELENA